MLDWIFAYLKPFFKPKLKPIFSYLIATQTLHYIMDKILEKYVFFATHLSNFTETEKYIIEHYAKNLTILQQKVSTVCFNPRHGKACHVTR